MSEPTWFELHIGPGWEVDDTKPGRTAFKRHTANSDGSHNDETAVLNAEGTSTFTNSHVDTTTTMDSPQRTDVRTETTFTTHDTDGTVLKE